jgi:hypothetical protein
MRTVPLLDAHCRRLLVLVLGDSRRSTTSTAPRVFSQLQKYLDLPQELICLTDIFVPCPEEQANPTVCYLDLLICFIWASFVRFRIQSSTCPLVELHDSKLGISKNIDDNKIKTGIVFEINVGPSDWISMLLAIAIPEDFFILLLPKNHNSFGRS